MNSFYCECHQVFACLFVEVGGSVSLPRVIDVVVGEVDDLDFGLVGDEVHLVLEHEDLVREVLLDVYVQELRFEHVVHLVLLVDFARVAHFVPPSHQVDLFLVDHDGFHLGHGSRQRVSLHQFPLLVIYAQVDPFE